MAETRFKIRTSYADESTRDYEFGPFATNAAAVANIKTNIAAVNADINNVGQYLLSDSGATCTGITAAQVITVNETEINLN